MIINIIKKSENMLLERSVSNLKGVKKYGNNFLSKIFLELFFLKN